MFKFLKNRMVLIVVGLLLLSLLIWFYGDYFETLDTGAARIAAIAILVAIFALVEMFKRARANQASSQLAAAVVGQAKSDQRPSADVVQLRERFEEALNTLKQQKKRGGPGLYELPWYVIIGAPGSGKTTALKYSGLKFPLEQRTGRGALRGVGGTRNCDWWFTEEAVLLDTAGRYTTQDSDASADSAGWAEFLGLLKKYRKRRPLNGVLLAISAHDLMTQGQAGREAHVAAARRRLNELNKELRIQLPVYVLVTKCDLLAGFSEYFEDMSQEARAQVFGVTFPKEVTLSGNAAAEFPGEFDGLVTRLNQRVFGRLEDERDTRRRARIFGFPQQMAALREGLSEFIGEVFESTRFDQRVLLRGVYFTSGTQEGTPIDRLLGSLGRRLAVATESVPPGKGKSYFIERAIKDVVLAESGLAGVSKRLEFQQAAAQIALYAGMLAAGAILILFLNHSYRTNRRFLNDFTAKARTVGATIPQAGSSALTALPRLNTLRVLRDDVQVYRDTTSRFSRTWGLDQSDWVEQAVQAVYQQELVHHLVETVKGRMEQRLQSLLARGGDPLELYLSLRSYLMLRDPSAPYFSREEVRDIAKKEWTELYRGSDKDIRELDQHFAALLDGGLSARELNKELIDRARRAIPPDALPRLILERLVLEYETQHSQEPRLFAGQSIKNKQGQPLDEGLRRFYSEAAFRSAERLINDGEKQFRSEDWVWEGLAPASRDTQREAVRQLYEAEYIRSWDKVFSAIGFPVAVGPKLAELIMVVSNERTGMKPLLQIIEKNTYLVPLPDDKAAASLLGGAGQAVAGYVSWARLALQGRKAELGAAITEHFSAIHGMVSPIGGKVLIDDLMAKMKDMGTKLQASQPGMVGATPTPAASQAAAASAQELQRSAEGLPPGPAGTIGTLISDLGRSAEKASSGQITQSLESQFQNVLQQCRTTINGRYPFVASAGSDVPIDDFKAVFGPEGQFAQFARKGLEGYAEKRNGVWTALKMSDGDSVAIGPTLSTLNAAEKIGAAFFPASGRVTFAMKIDEFESYGVRFGENLFDDGLPYEYSGQSQSKQKTLVWPTRGGLVRVQFVSDKVGTTRDVPGGEGAFALFRLLEKGSPEVDKDGTYRVRLSNGDLYVLLRLTRNSDLNPLGLLISGELRRFKCGS